MNLDPTQELAVDLIRRAPFGVVTGGPGTGKTTTLRSALDRLDLDGVRYRLASPTGKAAKRMSEATGREASTVHRLLEWTPAGFNRNARNPIDADLVVIDESSMLDTPLAADLMRAIAPTTRLVFVGDANQLPSVGPGRVLADLVESNAVPVARLTTVHRAAAESWVCRNAPRMLTGDGVELDECHDFRFVETEDSARVAEAVRVEVERLGGPTVAQVLAPQRTGPCGVEALSRMMQERFNSTFVVGNGGEWKLGDRSIRTADRVIHTKNNYQLSVFNGEVGDVTGIGERLTVDFGDRKVGYQRGEAVDLDLAYALTVHKSQGSEFPWAVCVVHSAHTYMLTRQLVYTAITRAKKGVVIVGNRAGLRAAFAAKDPPKRNTGLVARMRELRGE